MPSDRWEELRRWVTERHATSATDLAAEVADLLAERDALAAAIRQACGAGVSAEAAAILQAALITRENP